MELRRFENILAFRKPDGEILGYHTSNLEVAELSEEVWQAMANTCRDPEAFEALKAWNSEVSSEVKAESTRTGIQSLSINVTQLCNLQCVYCAAGGDGTYGNPQKKISVEKTLPQVGLLMDRLSEGNTFQITFLGGEPLLYPQGMQLIAEYALEKARARNLNLKFNIITNGTLLTPETVGILKTFSPQVTLSLDGPPELNDQVRPSKIKQGTTAQILAGLKELQTERDSFGSIGIQGVFGPYNANPLKAYLFYQELEVDWYDFHFDQENNDSKASHQFCEEMAQIGQLALNKGGESELRKIKFFDQLFHQLDTKTRIENYCGSGKSYLVLDSRNQAFLCPWAVNHPSLSVGQGTDLPEEKLQPLKKSLISTNNCEECWARFLCGGGCMWAHQVATGNPHKVDPVFCERTRTLISQGISYYDQVRKAQK